jgi:hypothetical protein
LSLRISRQGRGKDSKKKRGMSVDNDDGETSRKRRKGRSRVKQRKYEKRRKEKKRREKKKVEEQSKETRE